MSKKKHKKKSIRVGIISDTHGQFRKGVRETLWSVDHILHAGDIGDPEILEKLKRMAPVSAVRGNMDGGDWARRIPFTEVAEIGDVSFYILHDIQKLDLDPRAAGIDAVVFGHSHRPFEDRQDGVLFLNPGSAGPRRFHLPVSLVLLEIDDKTLKPTFIYLEA